MKTKTKKILAIIILATMVLTMIPITTVLAETNVDPKPEFVISHNLIMKRDETSTLDVTVNEKLEFTSFRAELDYDGDALEITGIEKGEILPNYTQLKTNSTGDKITGFEITSKNGEPIEVNAGEIMRIKVRTKDDANLGKYHIAWNEAELLNNDNNKMTITTIPGSVIIVEEGTNIEKAEFAMKCNHTMYPGEEQTISVTSKEKLEFNFISSQLLYDDNMEIVNITKGKALPNDAEIIPYHDGILGKISGFSIQGKGVIQIDPNEELVNITIKTSENATQGKGKFQIDWNNILNPDWNIVKADNTTANIEIMPQVTTELKGIEFTDSRIEISRGTEFKMQYKLTPENISPLPKIEWITANKDVATVDSNGVVTAVGVGETTITAKVGEYTATAQIIVTEKPTIKPIIEIRRNKLVVGETEQIDVKIEPEEMAQNAVITYSSSDDKIATVDDKGIIRAITAGKVRINVYIDGNLEKTFDIEVTEATVPETGDIQIELFIGMMIMSVIGIFFVVKIKKR